MFLIVRPVDILASAGGRARARGAGSDVCRPAESVGKRPPVWRWPKSSSSSSRSTTTTPSSRGPASWSRRRRRLPASSCWPAGATRPPSRRKSQTFYTGGGWAYYISACARGRADVCHGRGPRHQGSRRGGRQPRRSCSARSSGCGGRLTTSGTSRCCSIRSSCSTTTASRCLPASGPRSASRWSGCSARTCRRPRSADTWARRSISSCGCSARSTRSRSSSLAS